MAANRGSYFSGGEYGVHMEISFKGKETGDIGDFYFTATRVCPEAWKAKAVINNKTATAVVSDGEIFFGEMFLMLNILVYGLSYLRYYVRSAENCGR